MSDDNINCEVDDTNIFPSFHTFVSKPNLYYCYLKFIYNFAVDGGLLPDNRTITLDGNGRLNVPIDNDTIFVEEGEVKSKGEKNKPTNLTSLDYRTIIGGSDDYNITIDTRGIISSKPTNLISVDPRTLIGGTDYNLIINTSGIVDIAVCKSVENLGANIQDNVTVSTTSLYAFSPNTTISVGSLVIDPRGVIGRLLTFINDSTAQIVTIVGLSGGGGGHTYTSTSLNVDNVNDTIEFFNPALSSEQISIYDDSRLNSWIALMNGNMEWIQGAINGKMDDVSMISADPSVLTITKDTTLTNHPVFTFDIGQLSFTDLSNLRVDQDIKQILFESIPDLVENITVTFDNLDMLVFSVDGEVTIAGLVIIGEDGTVAPDFANDDYEWVGANKELRIKPYRTVTSIDTVIPSGLGEFILYQPPSGVQDVDIESSDDTIAISKTSASGIVSFDLKGQEIQSSTLEISKNNLIIDINIKEWVTGVTYGAGKIVINEGMIYQSKGATPGEFIPEEWVNLSFYPVYSCAADLSTTIGTVTQVDAADLTIPNQPLNTIFPVNSIVTAQNNVLGLISSYDPINSEVAIKTMIKGSSGDALIADMLEAEDLAMLVFE